MCIFKSSDVSLGEVQFLCFFLYSIRDRHLTLISTGVKSLNRYLHFFFPAKSLGNGFLLNCMSM